MPDNFQRGASPPPAPAGGEFFGLAAVVFGAGATIMLVAAIVAMYISSRSEDAVVAPAEVAAPVMVEADAEPISEAAEAEGAGDAMAEAEAEAEADADAAMAETAAP